MFRKVRLMSAAGLAILAASCGSSDKFQTTGGDVEGTVTLDGKPVEIGMVFFFPAAPAAGSDSVTAQLRAGGKFTTNNVPLGSVKIAVKTSHMKGMVMAGKGPAPRPDAKGGAPVGPAGTFVDVPRVYENADTSKLTADIVKGTNTLTLELKK